MNIKLIIIKYYCTVLLLTNTLCKRLTGPGKCVVAGLGSLLECMAMWHVTSSRLYSIIRPSRVQRENTDRRRNASESNRTAPVSSPPVLQAASTVYYRWTAVDDDL